MTTLLHVFFLFSFSCDPETGRTGGAARNKRRTNKSRRSIRLPYRNRPDLTRLPKSRPKRWRWSTWTEWTNTGTNRHTSKTINVIVIVGRAKRRFPTLRNLSSRSGRRFFRGNALPADVLVCCIFFLLLNDKWRTTAPRWFRFVRPRRPKNVAWKNKITSYTDSGRSRQTVGGQRTIVLNVQRWTFERVGEGLGDQPTHN